MVRNHLLILGLWLVTLTATAQQNKIDSLRQAAAANKDTTRINTLNALSFELVFSSPEEAAEIANQAIEESIELHYDKGLATAYRHLGISYDMRSDYIEAINTYKKALPITEKLPNDLQLASLLNVIGVAYYRLGQYSIALDYLLRALRIVEDKKDQRYVGTIYTNIGLVYHDQNDLDEALDYYEKGLALAEKAGDARLQGRITNNMGIIFNTKGLYEGALLYYNQSLAFKEKVNDVIGASATQQNLAVVYKNLGDLEKANELLAAAKTQKEATGDLTGLIQVFDTQIRVHIIQKKFDQARNLLFQSEIILDSIKSKEPYVNLYDAYRELAFAGGRYAEAQKWQAKKDSVKDLLFNEQKSNQLATLQSLYELDKKDAEIQLLQNERDRQKLERNIIIILVGSGVVVITILGLWFYQRHRQQKAYFWAQHKLHEAELQNAQLREAELKRELEFKKRELTSYTINFVQKGKLMDEIKENLMSVMSTSAPEVTSRLNPLKKIMDSSYQIDREWEDFKLRFEEVHQGFFEELKESFPDLSNNDLRLCALLRLNMNMKESAKILGISAESVKTSRYRLRKKLNLDKDENLNDFIMKYGSSAVREAYQTTASA